MYTVSYGLGAPRSPYGRTLFVDGNQGGVGYSGKQRGRAISTLAAALDAAESGDVIYLRGNITENIIAPAGLFNITIIGAGTRPRHADAHTGNAGYSGATWKAETSSDPLLTLRQQGWVLENILFACPTTDAAVDFIRDAASGDDERDSSHATIRGCRFAGGQDAIRITGSENVFNVLVEGNTFHDQTGTSIVSSGAFAHRWQIRDNEFVSNANHLDVGFTQAVIRDNNFGKFITKSIDLTGGANNVVTRNYLSGTYGNPAYVAGTDDEWGGNFNSLTGGVTADDPA